MMTNLKKKKKKKRLLQESVREKRHEKVFVCVCERFEMIIEKKGCKMNHNCRRSRDNGFRIKRKRINKI